MATRNRAHHPYSQPVDITSADTILPRRPRQCSKNSPPRWIEIAFDEIANRWRIEKSLDVGMTRLAGITFDKASSRWIVLSSKERTARCVDSAGRVSDAIRLPGQLTEGMCILPDGRTIVVHDSGGISIVEGLDDWIRSADRFSGQ